MMRPRNVIVPWTSKLPVTTSTPQPVTLPVFLICVSPVMSIALQAGGVAVASPKVYPQLLLIGDEHGTVSSGMSLIMFWIWAIVGADGEVEMLGVIGLLSAL